MLNAVEKIGREPESVNIMNDILNRMKTGFKAVLLRVVQKKEIGSKSNIHDYALLLIGCTYGLDIMSKFISTRDLKKYIAQVLMSLK